MRLYLFGHFTSTGGGRLAENFCRSIEEAGKEHLTVIPVNPHDTHATARMLVEGSKDDTALFFIFPNPYIAENFKGRKILWYAFEATHIPSNILAHFVHYDLLWVPSRWGYDTMIENGIGSDFIRIMPEGVNASVYYPDPLPHSGFIFLSIAKYEKRKGIDELIQAFSEEFPSSGNEDVSLWLKADHPQIPERIEELKVKCAFDQRIKITGGDYPESDLRKLYRIADAFVFPSRAEGFGLPGLEAIASGLPLLAVPYSGQSEYLGQIEGLYQPISYSLVPIQDRDFDTFFGKIYGHEKFGQWAEPDIKSLRRGMREIFENIFVWRQKALSASQIVRAQFDWNKIAQQALKLLLDGPAAREDSQDESVSTGQSLIAAIRT